VLAPLDGRGPEPLVDPFVEDQRLDVLSRSPLPSRSMAILSSTSMPPPPTWPTSRPRAAAAPGWPLLAGRTTESLIIWTSSSPSSVAAPEPELSDIIGAGGAMRDVDEGPAAGEEGSSSGAIAGPAADDATACDGDAAGCFDSARAVER
jgi:hypothetical protein